MTITTSLPPADVLELWRQVPFLSDLSEATVAALAQVAASRRVRAGEYIFNEGEPVAGLYLVESGQVKISRFSKEGREHILHILGRGDTFNDVAALDGGPNPATAIAYTDGTLWRIARPDLRRIATEQPALAWALIESVARRARYLVATVQDLAMRNVRGRLAHLLLQQAEAVERGDLPPALTQEDMASRLGTVREVVGRALRSLAAEGIIEFQRNRIVVLDRARLEAEADV
jgi:CRP/FNR family transcriptional regulator